MEPRRALAVVGCELMGCQAFGAQRASDRLPVVVRGRAEHEVVSSIGIPATEAMIGLFHFPSPQNARRINNTATIAVGTVWGISNSRASSARPILSGVMWLLNPSVGCEV